MSQTLNITLTDPATGATGSGSVTLTAPGPTPPPQSLGAGFKTLVFNDDFTNPATVATAQYQSSGANWYFAQRNGKPASPSEWSVLPNTAAAAIANGNTGGGNNASPNGGVLEIRTGAFPNENLITLPGWALNKSGAVLPPMGQGHWQHGYFEAYIQFVPNANPAALFSQTGWVAWFGWAAECLASYGFGSSSLNGANPSELDFLESFGHAEWSSAGNQDAPGQWEATLINHSTNWADGFAGGILSDSNWHTYGCLWVPGTISIYFDNALVGSVSTSKTALDTQSLFMTLGTGPNWPMYVDWVRVWQ